MPIWKTGFRSHNTLSALRDGSTQNLHPPREVVQCMGCIPAPPRTRVTRARRVGVVVRRGVGETGEGRNPPPAHYRRCYVMLAVRHTRILNFSRRTTRAAASCSARLQLLFGAAAGRGSGAVSYTHLRAHETPEHLVCRLLLEKKKQYTQNNNKHRLIPTTRTYTIPNHEYERQPRHE